MENINATSDDNLGFCMDHKIAYVAAHDELKRSTQLMIEPTKCIIAVLVMHAQVGWYFGWTLTILLTIDYFQ